VIARDALRALRRDLSPVGKDLLSWPAVLARSFGTVRGVATALYRFAQVGGATWPPLGHVVKQLNHFLTGADLAWQAQIGPGMTLYHPTGVVIGPHVVAGEGLILQQGVTIGGDGGPEGGCDSSPRIGDNVSIGPGARIFGRVEVGSNTLIGANAVVIKDVPSECVAVGVPASSTPRRRATAGSDDARPSSDPRV
jgi:serine O-acetyltransferase